MRIYNKLAHDPGPNAKKRALAQIDELIDRVVNDRWSIRRLERYARDLVGAGRASAPTGAAPPGRGAVAPPARAGGGPPFRRSEGGVFIDTDRIARRQVSPEEREELIKLLEELLMAVRRA